MSGYFAALAAQVAGQGVTAQQAATPASLEQHIEVETQTPAAATPASSPAPAQSAPEPRAPVATHADAPSPVVVRTDPTPSAARDTTIRIQELSLAPQSTVRPPAAEVAATSRPVGASPIDDEPRSIASSPFVAPQPAVQHVSAQPAPTVAPFNETTAREADQRQPIASRLEQEPPRQNPPSSVKRPEPIASIRPMDVARPIAQTVPTAPPPRSEIRIGTISLEVHVPPAAMTPPAPAPSVAAPAPTPAAAATPASTRFSLHRHYVRWG